MTDDSNVSRELSIGLFTVGGAGIGGLLGFLLRPAAPMIGQLPLQVVVTAGSKLQGFELMLRPLAERSFGVLLAGVIIGAAIGVVIGLLVARQNSH